MGKLVNCLLVKYYCFEDYFYCIFENMVNKLLDQNFVLFDVGCGRMMLVLKGYIGKVKKLIGVEFVEFIEVVFGIQLINFDLENILLFDGLVDLIMLCSVFEYFVYFDVVYCEMYWLLWFGGYLVFFIVNFWDYGMFIVKMVLNWYYVGIVKKVEG